MRHSVLFLLISALLLIFTSHELIAAPAGNHGPTATDLNCFGCVSLEELDFDTATQAELDNLDARVTNVESRLSEGGGASGDTQYVQLAPHTFRPRIYPPKGYSSEDYDADSLTHDYLGGQGIRFATAPSPAPTASTTLFSQAQLPSGAQITGMLCYVKDDDPTQDMLSTSSARLLRINPLDGADDVTLTNVSIGTEGLSGPNVFAATVSSASSEVSNKHFHYTVAITVVMNTDDSGYFDPMFRGCRIAYQP